MKPESKLRFLEGCETRVARKFLSVAKLSKVPLWEDNTYLKGLEQKEDVCGNP